MKNLDKKQRGFLDRIAAKSKYSIENDGFDIRNFERIKGKSKALLDAAKKGEAEYEQFNEMMQDTYDALYKNAPEVLEEWQIKTDYLLNY